MAEKTKIYGFKIWLSEEESERFEAYIRDTGMKKLAVARKAILQYIEENAPVSGK